MVNYDNGKIYKLECLTTGLIYVGSTTKKYLSERLVQHKCDYIRYLLGKMKYISSFEILENNNYCIGLLEIVNCNTKDELLAREGYYIKTLDCVNKHIAGRTKKEYQEDNKDKIKQYRQDNKEQIKEKHKLYIQNHKEQILEKCKQYRETYSERIKEQKNEKHTCECGGKYTNCSKTHHFKTIKHQTFLNNQI